MDNQKIHSLTEGNSERRLWTFEPVPLDGGQLFVDQRRPIALFVKNGVESFVEWREATIPSVAFSAVAYPNSRGVWIQYTPCAWTPGHAPGLQNTAVFVDLSGLKLSLALGRREVVGVDEQGLWTVGPQRVMSSDDFTGGTLPKGWVRAVKLIRHNQDGTTTRLIVDRPVDHLEATNDGITIVFYPTPPIANLTPHGGIHYLYPLRSISVPAPASRLTLIHVNLLPWAHVTDDAFSSGSFIDSTRNRWGRESALPRPLIPDGLLADWPTIDRSAVDVDAVIDRGLKEFSALNRLSETLSAPDMTLVGEWPTVDIVITFNWSRYPQARFRHVVQLFDQGGRPALTDYASVNFMEDLDTLPFTSPTEPVGEYIEF